MTMYYSKKFLTALVLILVTGSLSCENGLDVNNPNEPTLEVVKNEEGLKRVARGIYGTGNGWFEWIVWMYHESMGDNVTIPYTNYNWFYLSGTVEKVAMSDGTVVTPAASSNTGRSQSDWVNFVNDREDPRGAIQYEWEAMYRMNNEANLILKTLDEGVDFSGAPAVQAEKQKAYKAFAHFWKGYAYSRIGLMYERGLIIDEYGENNNNFVTPGAMLTESNRQFDLALQDIGSLSSIITDIQPEIFPTSVTAASMEQAANTIKARNLLCGSYRSELTQADWQEIKSLASNGLMSNDGALLIDSDEATFLTTITARWRLANFWAAPSARIIQAAAHAGNDQRLSNNFAQATALSLTRSTANPHLNAPFQALAPYASPNPAEAPQYLVSAEENMLMLAEAELALGNPDVAAGHINDVRTMQSAGVNPINSATVEDIYWERKIALFMRNLAFYDNRRFKYLLSETEGGGLDDAWIYRWDSDNSQFNLDQQATLYYDFAEYWPLPVQETTFNSPDGSGSPTPAN